MSAVVRYSIRDYDALREFVRRIIVAKAENSGERYNWDGDERRFARNLEGYAAELTVCEHYGIDFKWDVYERAGDCGHDVMLRGRKLGIKATRYHAGMLLVKEGEIRHPNAPDAYLLAIVSLRESGTAGEVRLVGYIMRREVLEFGPPRRTVNDSRAPRNYEVPQSALMPVKARPRLESSEANPRAAPLVTGARPDHTNWADYQRCLKLLKVKDVVGGVSVDGRRGTLINAQVTVPRMPPGCRVVFLDEKEIVRDSNTRSNPGGTPISRDFASEEIGVVGTTL